MEINMRILVIDSSIRENSKTRMVLNHIHSHNLTTMPENVEKVILYQVIYLKEMLPTMLLGQTWVLLGRYLLKLNVKN